MRRDLSAPVCSTTVVSSIFRALIPPSTSVFHRKSVRPFLRTARRLERRFYLDGMRESVRSLLLSPFEKTTEHAVKHIDDLMRQLEEVRRCGFAYDRQEMAEGVGCIAVPIEKGGRLYGLSVSVLRIVSILRCKTG